MIRQETKSVHEAPESAIWMPPDHTALLSQDPSRLGRKQIHSEPIQPMRIKQGHEW
jgi:hypothetical protein